jgi:rfaE bifunctional protein kinase chain/domain
MVRLSGTFSRLGFRKALVIGDLMLDTYTIGKVRRISPEAPVAVLQVQQEESRPGGAGNVILNLVSLGIETVAVGRIGQDAAGETLCQALANEKVNIQGIVIQPGFSTPVKNRIIADNQQIVRVDYEKITPIPELLEQQVIDSLPRLFEGIHVVAISDYGKGFLSRTLLSAIIEHARLSSIPVIADPKGMDFSKYAGSTIIKPNLGEAYAAANLPPDAPLEQVASRVLELAQAETLMVTRSEAGISLFHKDGSRHDFPVRIREVKDVTGAGDTVLAMVACAIANGLSILEAAQLSNIAAGIAIEYFGCTRVTLSQLARRLLEYDVVNKVFDEIHIDALQEALKGRRFSLISLSGKQGLTSHLFNTIRHLAQRDNEDLLVYVRDQNPSEEFVNILASLHDVDFIVLQTHSLLNLCKNIEPHQIYSLDNNELRHIDDIHNLLN